MVVVPQTDVAPTIRAEDVGNELFVDDFFENTLFTTGPRRTAWGENRWKMGKPIRKTFYNPGTHNTVSIVTNRRVAILLKRTSHTTKNRDSASEQTQNLI